MTTTSILREIRLENWTTAIITVGTSPGYSFPMRVFCSNGKGSVRSCEANSFTELADAVRSFETEWEQEEALITSRHSDLIRELDQLGFDAV